jgi:hypothetical protein
MDKRVEKLNDTNYMYWSTLMQSLLELHDIWTIDKVSSQHPGVAPVRGEATEAEFTQAMQAYNHRLQQHEDFVKADRKAKNYIVLCADESNGNMIRDVEGGKEAWRVLRAYHITGTMTRRLGLMKKLQSMKLERNGNMRSHLNKMDEIFIMLQSMEHGLDEAMKVTMMLASVRDEYETLVTSVSVWEPNRLTIQAVKDRFIEEWEQRRD